MLLAELDVTLRCVLMNISLISNFGSIKKTKHNKVFSNIQPSFYDWNRSHCFSMHCYFNVLLDRLATVLVRTGDLVHEFIHKWGPASPNPPNRGWLGRGQLGGGTMGGWTLACPWSGWVRADWEPGQLAEGVAGGWLAGPPPDWPVGQLQYMS